MQKVDLRVHSNFLQLDVVKHRQTTKSIRRGKSREFFFAHACALQGSDGCLNVYGQEKKKKYWLKANAVQKPVIQANKNQ